MKESEIRKRLKAVEEQLDRANQTIADLAKAAAGGGICVPCPCPAPAPLPVVNPPRVPEGTFVYASPFGPLPYVTAYYACSFPEEGNLPSVTWTLTTTPPGTGKAGK